MEVTMRGVTIHQITKLGWIFVLAGLLFCPGCSSPSAPEPIQNTPAPTIKQLGIVSLEDISLGVIASASFFSVTDALAVTAGNPYTALFDTCFITSKGEQAPAFPETTPLGATPLDAGDKIVVRKDAESYLELEKDTSGGLISYTASAEGNLPETKLTLDIPGKDFLVFTGVTFETIPAFELTAPETTALVTSDTTFSWTGSSENAVVRLEISQDEPAVSVACFAKDDGTFTFSEATKTELTNEGFTRGQVLLAARLAGHYEIQGGAALLLLTKQVASEMR
jgi:hypothetical protein